MDEDKILGFQSEESEVEDNSEEYELSDNELDEETRQYYIESSLKARENDYSFIDSEETKETKEKKVKKKKEKKVVENIFEEKKTWKSKRSEQQKRFDGKSKVEVRKFNPRPLPKDYIKNLLEKMSNKDVKVEMSEDMFPSLGDTKSSKSLLKPIVNPPVLKGVWGKNNFIN
jgi:hypothetical protein